MESFVDMILRPVVMAIAIGIMASSIINWFRRN